MIFNLTQGQANKPPVLDSGYPKDVTVNDGVTTSATFTVVIAEHGRPSEYTYQWYVNGEAVAGATGTSYIRTNLVKYEVLSVYCNVTNSAGTVQSRTATLTVVHTILVPNTGLSWKKTNTTVTADNSKTVFVADPVNSTSRFAYVDVDVSQFSKMKIVGSLSRNSGGGSKTYSYAGLFNSSMELVSGYSVTHGGNENNTGNANNTYDISSLTGVYRVGYRYQTGTSSLTNYKATARITDLVFTS